MWQLRERQTQVLVDPKLTKILLCLPDKTAAALSCSYTESGTSAIQLQGDPPLIGDPFDRVRAFRHPDGNDLVYAKTSVPWNEFRHVQQTVASHTKVEEDPEIYDVSHDRLREYVAGTHFLGVFASIGVLLAL